jgi:prophage antirepressor-like protein
MCPDEPERSNRKGNAKTTGGSRSPQKRDDETWAKTTKQHFQNQSQVATPISFSFEGQNVRTVTRHGEVWFVAIDICAALEIGNTTGAVGRLDDDQRGQDTIEILGRAQQVNVVSESGLYSLVFTSRKAEAKDFRRWVTGVVLPTIRRTGTFDVADQPQQTAPDDDQAVDSNAITITLPRWGRYIVVAAPDGERRIQPICVSDAISAMATLDCRAMAYAHMTTVMFWEKLQHLRASHVETGGGFSLEKLNESILAGADLARQILYTYDKPRLNLGD